MNFLEVWHAKRFLFKDSGQGKGGDFLFFLSIYRVFGILRWLWGRTTTSTFKLLVAPKRWINIYSQGDAAGSRGLCKKNMCALSNYMHLKSWSVCRCLILHMDSRVCVFYVIFRKQRLSVWGWQLKVRTPSGKFRWDIKCLLEKNAFLLCVCVCPFIPRV